ncbi:hypothetical protein BZA70DRAFT_266935 [Myxozyma melibiosi]|uniref:ubiquitinyl hydrolase 1 n=1 Tax=Myxozyma melibiosi TaxID=54550 RepID=A0ABR1F7J4_9ASCO
MSFFRWRGSSTSSGSSNAPAVGSSPQRNLGYSTLAAGNQTDAAGNPFASISELPDQGDGSDKFFGMENFGYTCYCNSVLQCLFYCRPFREAIINYPPTRTPRKRRTSVKGNSPHPFLLALKAQAEREALERAENGKADDKSKKGTKAKRNNSVMSVLSSSSSNSASNGNSVSSPSSGTVSSSPPLSRDSGMLSPGTNGNPPSLSPQPLNSNSLPLRGDDSATPEQKKKAALMNGPIINMDHSMNETYGMQESLFTTLKDIFEAMVENRSRTGIVSPAKLVEVLKRQNEMFRSSMHQDAHEFFNFLLNEVVDNVEQHEFQLAAKNPDYTLNTRWIHELFEGQLTSETKCLTCENVSRRDEAFLDLSIDLEQHSSVTSCLRQFSASEMLCESNKFHCDCCGGLQEAEKRMKIKRLPKILGLHLKRFKFTEDMQRNVKLFHKVVFPYHLRLFNTTDDVQDPDRLYELYSVVVHIGGGPYHGHYVSIVKTEHAGWVLYDDEMVERVDDDYVTNFFGDKPGLACAYILFYQEISEADYENARRYGSASAATTSAMDSAELARVITNPFLSSSIPEKPIVENNNTTTTAAATGGTPLAPTLSTPPSTISSSTTPISSASSASSAAGLTNPVLAANDSQRKLLATKDVSPPLSTTTTTPSNATTKKSPPPPPPPRRGSTPLGATALAKSNSVPVGASPPVTINEKSGGKEMKGKKEGSGGLSRFRSTSGSQNNKRFWKKDKEKEKEKK